MALEIIGAGFGRTGTTSLKVALERLGFAKCHHMQEVMRSRQQMQAWHDVAIRGSGDWDEIFAGFRASLDWPSSAYYKELMQHYPTAKIILTERDADSWYRSASETIYALTRGVPKWLRWLRPLRRMEEMINGIVWDGVFHGRFEDSVAAKRIYREHIEDVKLSVPAQRLLVFSVHDGWQPLCEFLGVPVPTDMPFPHVNERAEMKRALRIMQLIGKLPFVLLAVALVWLVGALM